MLNQVVMVGRITNDFELEDTNTGGKRANVTLAIPRSFKNKEGEYDTDFITCTLWDSVAERTKEYCRKGDIVGVKGRLASNTDEKENGETKYYTNVVAEKITFLSSKDYNKSDQEQER